MEFNGFWQLLVFRYLLTSFIISYKQIENLGLWNFRRSRIIWVCLFMIWKLVFKDTRLRGEKGTVTYVLNYLVKINSSIERHLENIEIFVGRQHLLYFTLQYQTILDFKILHLKVRFNQGNKVPFSTLWV